MDSELKPNTKLIAFSGYIGRYDYAFNLIFLCSIGLLFILPFSGYWASKAGNFYDLFNQTKFFLQSPVLLKIWVILGILVSSIIITSNTIRRLNDIYEKVNKTACIIFSTIFVLACLGVLFPFYIARLFNLAATILLFYLIFKKGKISSKLPYDYKKEFNWAAFFGTWIWGLFNKSYAALWMLILAFSPWGILFSLYCGMKGNEWAADNREWENLKKFQKSQETQTIVFVLLNVVIFPIACFIIAFAIVFLFLISNVNDSNKAQTFENTAIQKINKALNYYTSLYFESYSIEKNENKFYVDSKDWSSYSFDTKKDVLDFAASMSATERKKQDGKYHSKSSELNRTKIYDSKTKQLLGEFYIDESLFSSDKTDAKQILKSAIEAYRFYNIN